MKESKSSKTPEMDPNELKAFAEFLKLSENQTQKKGLIQTYKFKLASSVTLFAASIVAFKTCGDLLI